MVKVLVEIPGLDGFATRFEGKLQNANCKPVGKLSGEGCSTPSSVNTSRPFQELGIQA